MDPIYRELASRLDELPNGFPPTDTGLELELLAKIFTPEEAGLAARLRLEPETPAAIARRLNRETGELRRALKAMVRKGLIRAEAGEEGLAFGLMPFVVGIYEMQIDRLDTELAQRFEAYYQVAFREMLRVQPPFHRVVPVGESVRMDMAIRPYESAAEIIGSAKSWGALDCICRKQKALIGDPCDHPVDVCMTFSQRPGAYEGNSVIRALTQEEALATLERAAQAGLVHTVSNNQKGTTYLCNCCTCSCGILRGVAELGVADVVARSAFVNTVDSASCTGCEMCLDGCQFGALSFDGTAQVQEERCVGCGLCTLACPEGAMVLVRKPEARGEGPPETMADWMAARAQARGLRT
jgi:Fe-S-cluster-containing hydrogenase component 2